jgi:hypothetical protein
MVGWVVGAAVAAAGAAAAQHGLEEDPWANLLRLEEARAADHAWQAAIAAGNVERLEANLVQPTTQEVALRGALVEGLRGDLAALAATQGEAGAAVGKPEPRAAPGFDVLMGLGAAAAAGLAALRRDRTDRN